jgi:DNA-binding MarR family transcriptional regulator
MEKMLDLTDISLDEHLVLDACMFGATQADICRETGLGRGTVRRLLTKMHAQGIVRRVERTPYRHRKAQILWTRPED